MHRRVVAALGVAVAAAAFAGATIAWRGSGGSAEAAAARGTIAFVRRDRTGSRLFLMNGDGSAQRAVSKRADGFPAWSPDGRKIAYSVHSRNARLYVAKADGSGRRAVTPPGSYDCIEIAWSPDSRRIAYTLNKVCESVVSAIYVVNADGSGRKKLTLGCLPAWSPDGRKLVFAGSGGLNVMHADGRERRVIRGARPDCRTDPNPIGRPLAVWARDGRRIFLSDRGHLSVMNVDGTGRRRLIPPPLRVHSFALSPDQQKIAVAATDPRNREIFSQEIFVLNADGSGLRNLTNREGREFDPQWSPGGRRIAFSQAPGWYS